MSQYRYIKLRNGEDIVAITQVKEDTGTVEMTLPCNIGLTPSMLGKGTVIKLSPLVPFILVTKFHSLSYLYSLWVIMLKIYWKK